MKENYVINSQGEKERFSRRKVYKSARKVGVSKNLARKIAKTIEEEILPGARTVDIFERVKELLDYETPEAALKFSLKEAMRKLGPTGFPFEKYIGEIFSKNGFEVKLNQEISGFCCRYEIDFLAQKDNLLMIGECKYHNLAGRRIDLGVALENYARFLDIKNGNYLQKNSFKNLELKAILVTNTKFTTEAIKYSKCVGVELLGWNYPPEKGLESLIDEQKLYPITILPSFKRYLGEIFASKKMMLAEDLLEIDLSRFKRETKIPSRQLKSLIREAEILLRRQG